jgi:hypothetical protein
MKPKMSAAQLEARRKAGLSTSDPTHACSGAISNAKPDCEEKRDPDKRSLIIQKKENELDPDTQLEKQTFSASARVRPLILKADSGCLNLVCKVVVALDVRERTAPVA